MKKNIKLTILLILLGISLTGCVKFNSTMEIKKDKSINYTVIYAFDKAFFGNQEVVSSEDKEELEKKGFTVTNYVDSNMNGFKISKKIKNIDLVSSVNNTTYDLSGLLDTSKSESKIFKVKKGFLKNTYTANFKFTSSNSDLNNSTNNTTTNNDFTINNNITTNSDSDFSNVNTNIDLSFNVKLPYKAISSNATTKSNNDKDLSWNLSSTSENKIEFSFALYNMTNIYICSGIIIILIIIVVSVSKRNKNISKKTINKQDTTINTSNETPIINNSMANENTIEELFPQQLPTISEKQILSTAIVNNNSKLENLSTNITNNQSSTQENTPTNIFSTTTVNNNSRLEVLSTDTVDNQEDTVNKDDQIDTL